MLKSTITFLLTLITGVTIAQTNETPQPDATISPLIIEELNNAAWARLLNESDDRDEINDWVSFELTNYLWIYGADNFFTYGQVISPDSVPRVSFTGGAFRSFTHGFGQLFDPTALDLDVVDSRLATVDPYQIDSIGFPSLYRRVNHNGIDDTLLITVAITDKVTNAVNPYDGSIFWTPGGVLPDTTSVMSPAYAGVEANGYHYGLTGTSDPAANVEIQTYKFALTEADTEVNWRSFPVDISAEANQVV